MKIKIKLTIIKAKFQEFTKSQSSGRRYVENKNLTNNKSKAPLPVFSLYKIHLIFLAVLPSLSNERNVSNFACFYQHGFLW